MTNELIELCQKYKLKLSDTNKIYWFLSNGRKNDAINYLKPLVNNDYQIATKIVELYQISEQEQIQDGKKQIQNVVKQEFKVENENKPKCLTCGSVNVEKISITKKAFGGAMFGLFSSDVRNTMHCKNCGYKW